MKFGVGKRRPGIALLLSLGILGLLSLIGVSFALTMLLTRRDAANFLNSVKARYIAEAGIKRAMMDIRAQVASSSYNNLKTYIGSYVAASGTNVAFGDGTYTLAITSEEDKVDINQVEPSDSNQITALESFLTDQQIANLIDYRDIDSTNSVVNSATGNIEGTPQCKNAPYDSIEEIRVATGIDKATFDANAQKLTMSKPVIRGGLIGRYYKHITGTSPNVVIDTSPTSYAGKVVELREFYQHYVEGSDGDWWNQVSGWLESHDCEFAGGYLVSAPANFGMDYFGAIWTGYIEIQPGDLSGGTITKRFWLSSSDGSRLYINGTLVASYWQDAGSANFPNDTTAWGEYTFNRSGWYPIRLEYYGQAGQKSVFLMWTNPGGNFSSSTPVPAERFGYPGPEDLSLDPSKIYNSAGNYTITCTASALQNATVVAQKKITAIAQVFGTWTQTTKAEWHAAMYGDYAAGVPAGYTNPDGSLPPSTGYAYRDGEARNVNWEDACPLNATANLEAGGYATQNDSLKLGFWVDFDNDPSYTASMLKGLVRSEKWGTDSWINVYDDNGSHNFFSISWGDFRTGYKGTDNELVIKTAWHESRRFEVNPFYYFPSKLNNPSQVSGQPNVFARAWTAVNDPPGSEDRAYWKGSGTVYSGTWAWDGNLSTMVPTDPHVGVGIPIDSVSGNEMDNTPYTNDKTTGYGYNWEGDGRYHLGDRICKVWLKGTHDWHNPANMIGIYNATNYDLNNETASYDYWQPEVPFTTPMIYACGERMDSIITPGMPLQGGARGFGLLEKDNDTYWTPSNGMVGWSYTENNDMLELTLDSANGGSPLYNSRVGYMGLNFLNPAVLTVIGNNGSYIGWVDGGTPSAVATGQGGSYLPVAATASVNTPNFQFLCRNAYDVNGGTSDYTWTIWMVPNVVQGAKALHRTGGSRDMYPADPSDNTGVIMYFDNIRMIPASGFLVSTPLYAGESVKFGTVSWNPVSQASGTGLTVYMRATNDPNDFLSDTFASTYANGYSLNSTASWIQYKAVLTSTAFNPSAAYSNTGGVTPRLDDITITYLPTVKILYWKEG